MKILWIMFALTVLLSGCGVQPTFETIADDQVQPVMASEREVLVHLPADAAEQTMEYPGQGKLYFCQDYTISLQRLPGGNLSTSLKSLTGYEQEKLNLIETAMGDFQRYDFVCTAAGETGEQLIRGVLVDDGQSHYALLLSAPAENAKNLEDAWNEILQSYQIV